MLLAYSKPPTRHIWNYHSVYTKCVCACVCVMYLVHCWFIVEPHQYFAFTCHRKVRKLPLHYTFPTVVNNGNTDADYFLLCLTKTQDVCHLNASSSNLRYHRLPMSEARNSNELIHNSNETILYSRANPWSSFSPPHEGWFNHSL